MQIDDELAEVAKFWSTRYRNEGFIWGQEPSPCAIEAAQHFRRGAAQRLLVLGCGYGRDAAHFAQQGFDVTAVEFSAAALELARSWTSSEHGIPPINYLLDNIAELGQPNSSFDAVFSHRTLHLLLSKERLTKAFAHIRRVLKPGGLACVSLRNPRDPTRKHAVTGSGESADVSFRPGHQILFLADTELINVVTPYFSVLSHTEMQERESYARDYATQLHFLTLSKSA